MIYWIIRFVNSYRQYIIFSILILTSLLILSLNDSNKIIPLRKASFLLYAFINQIKSPFEEFLYYEKENEQLRRENAILTREVIEFQRFKYEREELYKILQLHHDGNGDFILSKIVFKSYDANGNRFIIDKGLKNGVRINSVAFNPDGIIGFISEASDNYSVITTINNVNIRISVKNSRSKDLGILSWDGEKFKILNVNKSADVKNGDIFITSEFSTLFPAEIPIARVIFASLSKDLPFYDITAKPAVNLEIIHYCMIEKPNLKLINKYFDLGKIDQ